MANHSPPLVVHVIYALATGGLENGLVNIINRSPAGRYQHVIVCITKADEFAARITAHGVRIIELNKPEGHDLAFYWRLWKLLRELRPDIIHSRNLAALETQLLSITDRNVKRVHGEHGRELNDLDTDNRKYFLLRRLMRYFIDHYIVVSKDLERWLTEVIEVSPGKVSQIYNGVDPKLFVADENAQANVLPAPWSTVDDCLVVGTVGRLSPIKDQHTLLRALDLLREQNPQLSERVRMLIVGDGPLRQLLSDTASELGLDDQVWFAGSRDDVSVLLKSMDIFVLPSLSEGISNTVLEAMASGLPVIATAVGGNSELIEEGFSGLLVPVADPTALAEALVKMLENKALRQSYGANARRRVCQRFDWSSTVQSYLQVYDDLLGLPATNQVTAE